MGIHNTLEAAIYGLPIAFGPRYKKFNEAKEMIACGIAKSVSTYKELSVWFTPLRDDAELWQQKHTAAQEYTKKNIGATDLIIEEIFGEHR